MSIGLSITIMMLSFFQPMFSVDVKAASADKKAEIATWEGGTDIMSKDGPSDWTKVSSLLTGSEQDIKTQYDFTSRIEQAVNQGGWVSFLTHGLVAYDNNGNATYSPTSYEALTGTLEWISQRDSDVWVAPLGYVAMYIKERNASTFALKDSKNNSDTYTLTHNIADSVCSYQYPLSVRVSVPNASGSVSVTQNGKAVEAGVLMGWYILVRFQMAGIL